METKPLLNDSEGGKRPTILYIIIAVLAIAVIALIIVVAVKKCDDCNSNCPTNEQTKIPYDSTHLFLLKKAFIQIKMVVPMNYKENSIISILLILKW